MNMGCIYGVGSVEHRKGLKPWKVDDITKNVSLSVQGEEKSMGLKSRALLVQRSGEKEQQPAG